jgi:hypothetical protein
MNKGAVDAIQTGHRARSRDSLQFDVIKKNPDFVLRLLTFKEDTTVFSMFRIQRSKAKL